MESPVPPPPDRMSTVYFIFYVLGLGTLLPWNFFITAQGYWTYKFRDVNATIANPQERTDLQTSFTSYLSVASMIPNTTFLMLNAVLAKRIPLNIRLLVPLGLVIILFIITDALVQIDTDHAQRLFFTFTLVTVVLLNCNTAVFQGALFGLAGMFPSRCTRAVMNGQALGGIFASVASILSLMGGHSDVDSAFIYFLSAIVVLVAAGLSYFTLPKFEYYRFHVDKHAGKGEELLPIAARPEKPQLSLWKMFLQIKVQALSVCFVFVVTLSVFPAVTALVSSDSADVTSAWKTKYFLPVGCFLVYNVGDYFGRTAAGWVDLPKTKIPLLPLLCVLRIGFIPILMLCNASPRKYTSVVFQSDYFFVSFMALFSISNGYLASQAMIQGPKQVEPEQQETAGATMAFFLGLGLMIGAALSTIFVNLL